MKAGQLIKNARTSVAQIVKDATLLDSHVVIARYTAAMAINFTDWIGKTIPWARHEDAQHALVSNLRCEAVQDHVQMLITFANLCGADPERRDYGYTSEPVSRIRKLFQDPLTAGLSGVTLCAVLENTSEIFIPDLARRGKKCGCTDFTYTDVHGVADIEHSVALRKATDAEQTMGYRAPALIMENAANAAIKLIHRIYF